LKCLELYAKIRSYFRIFTLHVYIFIKIIADSWSPLKTESIDMSFVYFQTKNFFSKKSWGISHTKHAKKFFWDEPSEFIYQSTQFSTEIKNLILFLLKNVIKKAKIARYEPIYTRHFNNSITNNYCTTY